MGGAPQKAGLGGPELSLDLDLGLDLERVPKLRLLPGQPIPGTRYRMLRWLGEGGMGVIYEVEHIDLERHAAIKILHGDQAMDDEHFETFRTEARATTRVGSDYIVDVLDFDVLPDGRPMCVMEMLHGEPLNLEIGIGAFEVARLIPILRQACKGLAAAHAAGVIHRDIKPENLFRLDPDPKQLGGRADRIKILDFGVAGMLGRETVVGGSPHYMAPEQILTEELNPASDMYALGCTAYELLAGSPPFPGDSVGEILKAQVEATPPPLGELVDETQCPAPVAAVIMRCLEKKPGDRFASMEDLEASICEAQIEAGIVTAWDDLPVPDVEPERKKRIEEALARNAPPPSALRRWLIPLLIAGAAAVAAITWAVASPVDVGTEPEPIAQLSREARQAAARALYVYPSPNDPDAPTAYDKILELELMEGEYESAADARAADLRREFSSTLVYLGDHYWARDGGRPFAIDYYAQALLFDGSNPRARERGALTPGQLEDLRRKANEDDFTQAELEAAAPLAALAEEDEAARSQKLGALLEEQGEQSVTGTARLASQLEKLGEKPVRRVKKRPRPPPSDESLPPDPDAAPDSDAESRADRQPERDPAEASRLAAQAHDALRKNQRAVARKLFHAAIAADPRNHSALIGLSDLHFADGHYARAVPFAERAVRQAPGNASYRLKLGDAYYKVLRYNKARMQYDQALKLGHKSAKKRLETLAKRVGE